MGNSGPKKLLFPLDNVQTKFNSIDQIDLMSSDKQLHRIPKPTTPTLFVHYKSSPPQTIKTTDKQPIYYLSDAENLTPLKDINQNNTFVKITMNGEYTHPLIKLLKKNTQTLYDYQGIGGYQIKEQNGCFLLGLDGNVKYFPESKFNELNNEILNI